MWPMYIKNFRTIHSHHQYNFLLYMKVYYKDVGFIPSHSIRCWSRCITTTKCKSHKQKNRRNNLCSNCWFTWDCEQSEGERHEKVFDSHLDLEAVSFLLGMFSMGRRSRFLFPWVTSPFLSKHSHICKFMMIFRNQTLWAILCIHI